MPKEQKKQNTLIVRSLVTPNKDRFITTSRLDSTPYIVSFFNIIGGEPQPSLILNVNRWRLAKSFLRALPSVFVMNSDGHHISIDAVHKLIQFEPKDYKGIVQYHITDYEKLDFDVDAIFKDISKQYKPIYIRVKDTDEMENTPDKLKVFRVIFYQGCMVSVVDSIEKVIHLSILDKETGYMGSTPESESERISLIQHIWPELGIQTKVENNNIQLYCQVLKNILPSHGMFVKVHRNFGGTDLSIFCNYQLDKMFLKETEE